MEVSRETLKKLWNGEEVICPNCEREYLIPLHKNKKDNNDFKCPRCNEIFRTINIFSKILNKNK